MQVEPEGRVLVEPQSILDRREVLLRKKAITQIKVQWPHFGPDEATWEDEEFTIQAYPKLFMNTTHWDDVHSQEGEM